MITETGTDINKAVRLLTAGNLVAVPTETVYGLAANALDPVAVTEVFKVKERPFFDPLIVHIHDSGQLNRYVASVPPGAESLMDSFWPGPLTLLFPRRETIHPIVTAGLDRVAIRCPDHPMLQELLSQIPFPLAAPSANPFGYVSPTRPEHVLKQLHGKIPYVLDGGPCVVGIESTILGYAGGAWVIHRQGGVSRERIEAVIGPVQVVAGNASAPTAPGMLDSHYAPLKPLTFLSGTTPWEQVHAENAALICLKKPEMDLPGGIQVYELSPAGNLDEAARNLFACMRDLDQSDHETLFALAFPETGLGVAINDRLRRAAAKRN